MRSPEKNGDGHGPPPVHQGGDFNMSDFTALCHPVPVIDPQGREKDRAEPSGPRRTDTLSFCDEGQLAPRSAWGPFHSAAGLPRPAPGIPPGDRPRPCASRGAAQGAAARSSGHQSRPAVNPSDPRPGPGRTTPHGLVILPHRSRTAPRRRGAACKRPCRASLTWRVRLPATAQGGRYAFSATR